MAVNFKLTQENYRYLFDNASDAMWVQNMAGEIVVANRACESLTGYSYSELVGTNITRFLTSQFLGVAREVRHKLLRDEPFDQPYEQSLVCKDGSTRILLMSTSLVVIDGEVRGFEHTARDVTEEKSLQENMTYYVQQITRAQEEERKRISRELHDDLAPMLLLVIQRLDAITARTRPQLPEPVIVELAGLRSQAVQALEGLRLTAQNLRPRILDDLGLVPALEWMAENQQKNFRIATTVSVIGRQRSLPSEVQLLLFRIAQEALSNVRKHARADESKVTLHFNTSRVKLTISDNGIGFAFPEKLDGLASNGKLGIMGMHERARLLGGNLKIKSEPGKGTQVAADIPA